MTWTKKYFFFVPVRVQSCGLAHSKLRATLLVEYRLQLIFRRIGSAVHQTDFKALLPCTKILARKSYSEYLLNIESCLERQKFKPFWSHVRTSIASPAANIKLDGCILYFPYRATEFVEIISHLFFHLPYPYISFPIASILFHPILLLCSSETRHF